MGSPADRAASRGTSDPAGRAPTSVAEGRVRRAVVDLYPGYFALVMATGIVSIAAYLLEMPTIARALLWVNVVAYAALWLLTLLRLAWYGRRVLRDFTDHARGPGFFTAVAATCVLGSQFIVLRGSYDLGIVLFALGLGLWVILIYGFFTAITVRTEKPFLSAGINGSWLIAIVATQSVSILGARISQVVVRWEELLLLFALAMFLFGCMLYILTITLIFYRFTFFRLEPEELTAPYWINMGAVAITTLAGATLVLAAARWSFLTDIAPFLKGFTLFFWATATWWIPLLFVLGAWRHLYRRFPLRYHPEYWGMVFPLGMYTACTFQLGLAAELPLLFPVARGFVYVALAAWVAAFIGLLYTLASSLARSPAPRAEADEAEPGLGSTRLRVHCPVHAVEAEVHLFTGPGGRPQRLEACSLYPGWRGGVPCEGHCITAAVEQPVPASALQSGTRPPAEAPPEPSAAQARKDVGPPA